MSKRLLVIEDDPDILTTVAELLELEGYQVQTANQGAEALQILKSTPTVPDLIILDYMMPEMNGAEFRSEQLKSATIANVPVLLMTADAQPQNLMKEVGARGLVRKPIDIDQFLSAIEDAMKS